MYEVKFFDELSFLPLRETHSPAALLKTSSERRAKPEHRLFELFDSAAGEWIGFKGKNYAIPSVLLDASMGMSKMWVDR